MAEYLPAGMTHQKTTIPSRPPGKRDIVQAYPEQSGQPARTGTIHPKNVEAAKQIEQEIREVERITKPHDHD